MKAKGLASLGDLSVSRAVSALAAGELDEAVGWLRGIRAGDVERGVLAGLWYACAKAATSRERWHDGASYLESANGLHPTSLYQQRLHLLRLRHAPAVPLRNLGQLARPRRLRLDQLAPEVDRVVACGQYHARDASRGAPWSRLLREAKNPPRDAQEREAILGVAKACLCHVLLHETDFLRDADAVLAIPPDPERYATRGHSLPDVLAKAVQEHLALPWNREALVRIKAAELRGLSPADRAIAVAGSMKAGSLGDPVPHTVLVVDDVITYGSTLREAGRVLRAAGVTAILGAALSHTEG
jgi:hypothetical protein